MGSAWLVGISACPDDATGHVCLFNVLCLSPAMSAHGIVPILQHTLCHPYSETRMSCLLLAPGRSRSGSLARQATQVSKALGMMVMGWKVPFPPPPGKAGCC